MTPELALAARKLLGDPMTSAAAPSAAEVAGRAGAACRLLTEHLARIVGDNGTRTLFNRSVALTRGAHPWMGAATLAAGTDRDAGETLRAAMAAQPIGVATEGFTALLDNLIALLGRLLGESLVERVLDDIWPRVFAHPGKELP